MAASSLACCAHDALLGQRDGAAGVGLLVVVVGLRLGQRSPGGAHLGLGVDGGAAGFAAVWRSVSTVSPSLHFWLAAVASAALRAACKIVALDDGDKLAGLHILALIHRQRLDAAGNLGAHHHLVGIHGADQLQVARWAAP